MATGPRATRKRRTDYYGLLSSVAIQDPAPFNYVQLRAMLESVADVDYVPFRIGYS